MRQLHVLLLVVLFSLTATEARCWTVPATGITACYNNSEAISCPNQGEPFYGQNGTYPGTPHTFLTDDTTATDQITGLLWQRTPDGQARTLTDAANYCDSLDLAGRTDWRLPSQRELATLVDHARSRPAWSPDLGGTSGHTWSQTPYLGYAGPYWYVNFALGTSEYGAGTDPRLVRCVRGPALADSTFIDHGTTVADTTTGLTWEKAASAAGISWQDALATCQASTTGGYTDWRTPNVMELRTLVAYDRVFPAVDATLFPDSQHSFWTNSTTAGYPGLAWQVNFNAGESANEDKTSTSGFVRCVRTSEAAPIVLAPIFLLLLP